MLKIEKSIAILYIIGILLISFIILSPYPFLFLCIYIFFIFYSIIFNNAVTDAFILILSFLLPLLNWTLIALGQYLWGWDDILYIAYARGIALFGIIYILIKYFTTQYNAFFKPTFLILILLIFNSFLKASDSSTALNYLFNVYIPFLLFVFTIFCIVENNILNRSSKLFNYLKDIVPILIIAFIVLICFFAFIDLIKTIPLKTVYGKVAEIFRSTAPGKYHLNTLLFHIKIERYPGIFGDPILAGYSLVLLFWYIIFYFPNTILKVFFGLITLLLTILTISKAAFLSLLLGVVFLFIYLLPIIKSLKKILFVIVSLSSLLIMILVSLSGSGRDSSYIHALGLTLPFNYSNDISYFLGHDLGSGGNMGGWVEEGAESFIGLVMYNLGLVGVFIICYWFLKIGLYLYNDKKYINKFLISSMLPIFLLCFLQENSFNLSYTIPRISLIILALGLSFDKK